MGKPPDPLEKVDPRNYKLRTVQLKRAILKFFALPENRNMDFTIGMAKILRQILLDPFSGYVYHICKYPKKKNLPAMFFIQALLELLTKTSSE